ncbi:MAG: site-specific DNA-methyltransferase [Desulfomonilaceae bacterium]|jgi:DNA modification methylase
MESSKSGEKIGNHNYRAKNTQIEGVSRTTTLDKSGIKLVWKDKQASTVREIADFELIERVGVQPTESDRSGDPEVAPAPNWTNKIIRGDNKLVMNSLFCGQLHDEIQAVGGIKLVYIDPPFLVGADYNINLPIGEDGSDRLQVVESLAYRDTWQAGPDAYLTMMYDRIGLIKDILAEDGSIWVHCDCKANFMIRSILEEIFGPGSFRNEIIWYYTNKIPDTRKRQYTNSTDTIFYYSKSSSSVFNWQFDKREKPIKVSQMKKVNGKKVYPKGSDGKCVYVTRDQRTADNVWKMPLLHAHPEMWGYPTQKPLALLERIVLTGSNPGDVIADFFCGSGTTLEAAQKLGRKWIGCDLGKIAVHTCRKRMSVLVKQALNSNVTITGFDVLGTVRIKAPEKTTKVEPHPDGPQPDSDGQGSMFDSIQPLTSDIIKPETAGHFEARVDILNCSACVTLTGFSPPCREILKELVGSGTRMKSLRVIEEDGSLFRVWRNRQGEEQKHLLTKKWTDWIDYWSVDFHYGVGLNAGAAAKESLPIFPTVITKKIFNSHWQDFRTPKKRSLELTSSTWKYVRPGKQRIAVRVIDIFGNEAEKVFGVEIP